MIDSDYGTIKIKLDKLLETSGLSKNKLAHRAEMQRSQLNAYCNNTITRLDIAVLARLCTVLECRIDDLLEFIPAKKQVEKHEYLYAVLVKKGRIPHMYSPFFIRFVLKYLLHFLSPFTPLLLHFKNQLRYFAIIYGTFPKG